MSRFRGANNRSITILNSIFWIQVVYSTFFCFGAAVNGIQHDTKSYYCGATAFQSTSNLVKETKSLKPNYPSWNTFDCSGKSLLSPSEKNHGVVKYRIRSNKDNSGNMFAVPPEKNDNNDEDGSSQQQKVDVTGRLGGRSRIKKSNSRKSDSSAFPSFTGLTSNFLPILLLLLLFNFFSGLVFGNSSRDDMYYQSFVYESRTYNSDGLVERVRKESVKSNIPNIMNGNQVLKENSQRDGNPAQSSIRVEPIDEFSKSIFDAFFE